MMQSTGGLILMLTVVCLPTGVLLLAVVFRILRRIGGAARPKDDVCEEHGLEGCECGDYTSGDPRGNESEA